MLQTIFVRRTKHTSRPDSSQVKRVADVRHRVALNEHKICSKACLDLATI